MCKSRRRVYRVLSVVLSFCLVLGGFSVGQIFVSAAEITGYQDEAVVRFRNAGSGKYLNVHNGQNANKVNVYQWTADGSTEQKFKLRYNLEDDCYMIGTMCSSNGNGRVLDIVKSNGQVKAGCNVQIYNAVDPTAQEWQFAYQGEGKFVIFPTANYYAVLTANGNSNGSGGGTSSSDAGNVYLSAIAASSTVNYSEYQLWYIEEVSPAQTIDGGLYRITNDNDKHMTLDVEDDYNVCQMGNISQLSTDEWSKAKWRQQQLWYVDYLHSGYYLITPYIDGSQKLSVFGNYEALEANVYVTYDNASTGTWSNRQQWKIVPNADGAYRVVSKGSYDSQVITVYQGETDNFTNIQMVPYTNAPSQRWTFEAADHNLCDGAYRNISGHTIDYDAYNYCYKCVLCGMTYDSPEVQDYENNYMTSQDRALIFALQRAAMLESLDDDNDSFVQSCYRMIDMIRSSYNGDYMYEFSDEDDNYVSPVDYKCTANTVNTRLEITVETQLRFGNDIRNVIWRVGESVLPPPFNAFNTILMDYFEEYEWCSWTEGIDIILQASVDGVLQDMILERYEDLTKAIRYANILNTVGSAIMNEERDEEIHIQISMQGPEGTHNFSGIYRISDTTTPSVCVVKESYITAEGQAWSYEANTVNCIYYSKEGYREIKPYAEIF